MKIPECAFTSAPLPRSWDWEFGGHVYGLEPLALSSGLPRPITSVRGKLADEYEQCVIGCKPIIDMGFKELCPVDTFEIDRVFWFRWITGHQTTFALWQMLAAVLEEARTAESSQELAIERIRRLVRGYSLMLLYTSSAPRDIYERVIRQPMARQHPNLSGTWAPDYQPVRSMIRGKLIFGDGLQATLLQEECRLNERIHEAIAEKLVPSGVSLLQSRNPHQGDKRLQREMMRWLYDGIFLTSRADISYEAFIRQFIRRAHAILLDLFANGLYPKFATNLVEYPPTLLANDITNLMESSTDVLADLAELAAISLIK